MRKSAALLFTAAMLFTAAPASAQILVTSSNGNIYDIPGPIEDQVTGSMMGSFTLTARWLNGTSRVMSYGFLGGTTYGFSSDLLSLTLGGSDDTFFTYWAGSNSMNGLYELEFDAANTNVLFDRTYLFNLAEGTPGSNIGWDGDIACNGFIAFILCELGSSVHYTDAARFSPEDPVGDVFRKMTVSISGNGLAAGQDGDFLRFDTDITTVPEPSTYALMAAGLAGLGYFGRRRRNA